jgi:pantoate--beta-alanine ligase
MKLLQIVRPDQAYFGEKDYQQYLLIDDMARAFFLKTKIIPCPTLREPDGLAMSSRNIRLNPEEREKAPLIYKLLNSDKNLNEVSENLSSAGFIVDYCEEKWGRRFVAAKLGQVRLIDNAKA